MTQEDQVFLDRIHAYAEQVMGDIDPQKTKISVQLDKIKPILEEISIEQGVPVTDVFVRYMDLASTAATNTENEFQSKMGNAENTSFNF